MYIYWCFKEKYDFLESILTHVLKWITSIISLPRISIKSRHIIYNASFINVNDFDGTNSQQPMEADTSKVWVENKHSFYPCSIKSQAAFMFVNRANFSLHYSSFAYWKIKVAFWFEKCKMSWTLEISNW